MAMITLKHINKCYEQQRTALSNINLSIATGEMAFLTGHSGAGKSTLLKLIALIERPTQGKVCIDGVNLATVGARDIPYVRRRIGMIFQNPQLLSDRSVFDNVALPLIIAGWNTTALQRRVQAALHKVGLADKGAMMPNKLSGGEQQRVGIARAIVSKPAVLLADEPTGNLDPELSEEIMHLFEDFQRVGVTVLIASHDLRLIAKMKHRVITLKNGRVINDGLDQHWKNHSERKAAT